MGDPVDILLERLEALIEQETNPQKRIIIALAGAPGSGKSTVASALTERFNSKNTAQLQVVPMV
jgi:pantothenate kinase